MAILSCDDELRSHPMVRAIESYTAPGLPFNFRASEPFFTEIITSDFPLTALKLALKRVQTDSEYQLSRFVMEEFIAGWTLLIAEEFAISVGVRAPMMNSPDQKLAEGSGTKPTHSNYRIQPYPCDMCIGFLNVGSLTLKKYEVMDMEKDANDSLILRHVDSLDIENGDHLMLKAGVDATTADLTGPLVYLEIAGPITSRVVPQFDQYTHELVGYASGDPRTSRLELLTRVLADFEHQPAVDVVEQLCSHDDYYVRWNSMRHLLRIDAARGMARLKAAQDDAHPEIRKVSRATLAIVETA